MCGNFPSFTKQDVLFVIRLVMRKETDKVYTSKMSDVIFNPFQAE